MAAHIEKGARWGAWTVTTVVWAYNAALLSAAVSMVSLVIATLPQRPGIAPWWLFAVACFAVESFVVYLRFGRQAASISLGEVVLALGLAFASPLGLVVGRLLGEAATLAVGRSRNVAKVLFNLSLIVFETTVALWVFSRVSSGTASDGITQWRAVFVATAAAILVNQIVVVIMLQVHKRSWQPKEQILLPLLSALANTSLGALAVVVLGTDLLAGLLLLGVGAVLLIAYKSYNRLREQHESLTLLQDLAHSVGNSLDAGETGRTLLEQTRKLLRAEVAEVVLLPDASPPIRLHLSQQGTDVVEELHSPDPGIARTLAEGGYLLATRHEQNGDVRAFLIPRGFRDAIVVPLRTASTKGWLMVGNRLGETASFATHDMRLLQAIADHASILLENDRLIQRLRREVADKEHQASHDALTGLPNRVLFNAVIRDAIANLTTGGSQFAVMLLDLNGFKDVNDTLGHHVGDVLLKQVAERLLAGPGIVARLGGDEFGVLLTESSEEAAQVTGQRTHRALEEPFVVAGSQLYVGASIGVALFPCHADTAEQLLQRADVAMYQAKGSRSGCCVYDPEHDRNSHQKLALAAELRATLEAGGLQVHYQPKAAVGTGRVIGVEALVRWIHPERGFIPPDEFIPLAERTGLIHHLTECVLDLALTQQRAWREVGYDINVAVNVSAGTILAPGFLESLKGRLKRLHVPGEALTLELTESQVMADPDRAVAVLRSLREVGIRVSIDDFGTGYSSLSQLKRLPVDELKIDKSFVFGMCRDDDDAVIVRSTIELAHNLGLQVVAEGVEDAETWQRLASLRCDSAQGYYLSRPVPATELTTWLESSKAVRLSPRPSSTDLERVTGPLPLGLAPRGD